MLELPESKIIAEQLNDTVKGKFIMNVYANSSPHSFAWYFDDPSKYHDLLCEKKITSAKAVAGQVEITCEDSCTAKILLGDGVNIRYFGNEDKLPPKHQLHIEFEDNTSIVCVVQMYGGIWAFPDCTNDNPYYLVAQDKPTPFVSEFNSIYFSSLLTDKTIKLSAKAFLATEQRIPGLGNGVLQDILFNAKIHPKRKMSTLSDNELDCIFKSVKSTIFDMASKGGRNTERDLFGCKGGYTTVVSKNTVNNPCQICGTIIKKEAYLGGAIYYCSSCQKL